MFIAANIELTGSYDYGEVARSLFIAFAASYAALDLAGRVTAAKGLMRTAWWAGGAVAMGIGIWAMHMKGMLAFHLPVPVEYHWPTTLAALLAAILASAVALYVSSRQKMSLIDALAGSLMMAVGIAGLHYLLMAAMRMAATIRYSTSLVALSIFLAILFSLIALVMAFGLREQTRWTVPRRLGSATVLGAAISAMHYTGMAAASFIPASPPDLSHALSISPLANNGLAIATLMVLMAAVVTSSVEMRRTATVRLLNQELESRVVERTRQFEAVNQALRKEIAERKRTEDELRKQKEVFQRIFEDIPVMIGFVGKDGRIELVNPEWQRTLGWTQEEIREQDLEVYAELFPDPEYRRVVSEAIAASTGEWTNLKVNVRDGRVIDVAAAFVLLSDGSSLGIGKDITEWKRTQAALHEAHRNLARVTRVVAMGELAATIAHEVNQPLTAIVTNANFGLRELAEARPHLEKLREAIAEIVCDGTRASAVISRIRALLKEASPNGVNLDINEVIQEVTTLLRNEIARNRVELQLDLAADLPLVFGDRVQLQQVLINLAINGIEAMHAVDDRPRRLAIKSERQGDGVLVQVKDSGIGLDPDQVVRIFEPFFTTKAEGIGMGLSISRSIMESHGGRLSLVPGSSKGAVFQFTLPIKPNDAS
jgi:PAS domain S-box-containing protein